MILLLIISKVKNPIMKIIRYILLVIITLIFGLSVAINAGLFFFAGLGGTPPVLWTLLFLFLFVASIICFRKYTQIAQGKISVSPLKETLITVGTIIFSLAPILSLVYLQILDNRQKLEYENTCKEITIDKYRYDLCEESMRVLDYYPGTKEYNDAMKVWDTKGASLYR